MQKKTICLALIMISLYVTLTIRPSMAAGVVYGVGDVFAGVGNGKIKHFDNQGNLLDTLDTTGTSAEEIGMTFDNSGNLYTADFSAGTMTKFDNMGNMLVHPWGGPFSVHPESVVVDAAGNLYTGEVDGQNKLRKWDAAGSPLGTWSPATQNRGIDWIDLAADQKTIFYTSEGNLIKRFDVSTSTQLADFATLPTSPAYALRIRPNGEVLVATSSVVHRLDSTGTVIQSYQASTYGELGILFALNLDPDGASFWTAGYSSGNIYRIDIATGNLIKTFNGGKLGFALSGLAIFGEITVGKPPFFVIPEYPFGTILALVTSLAALTVFGKSRRMKLHA